MDRPILLRVLAVISMMVMGVVIVFAATPAHAAPKPIGLSSDGITYTDALSTDLFADLLIVPGGSATRTFWVKNRAGLDGNLAIALQGVTGADPALISSLSLRTTAGSTPGSTTPFTAAAPCASLQSGIHLAAGATVKVEVRLALGTSLNNHTSQGSIGAFRIPMTLTSTDVPAPTGCTASTPVNPPAPGGNPGSGTPATPPGTIGTTEITGASDGVVPGEVDNGALSGLRGKGTVRGYVLEPNTGRFFQEFDIAGWLVLMILGGMFAWWRSRRDTEEEVYA